MMLAQSIRGRYHRDVMSGSVTTFQGAWWLPGRHAQTVWGRLTRPTRGRAVIRERLVTPDRDELWLDHLEGPAGAPRLILLHGLEGSSNSVYLQGLLGLAARRGWRATALNFRSCARRADDRRHWIPNRGPRLYHSGDTGDFDFVIRTLAEREPAPVMIAAGVSLGGNVLLKWLGENPGQRLVRAGATMSVPYDLSSGARQLERGLGPMYARTFLRSLKVKIRGLARRFPEAAARIELGRALAARTFREFDDAATAPLHGFDGADDYYRRSSSLAYLPHIDTRTLCLSALDDPFLPADAVHRAREAAAAPVTLEVCRGGGHAGFVEGAWPGRPRYWGEERLINWLAGIDLDRLVP